MRLLFEPRGVAVIGASRDPHKIGYKIVANVLTQAQHPPVQGVNPKGGEVLGVPLRQRIADLEPPVDLAVIAIPAPHVLAAARECAEIGVRHLVVVSSGFSEVGNVEEEGRLVAFAREHGMRVLGPNIFGLFVAGSALNAGFAPADIDPGGLAIITQSGAMGGAMIGKTAAENIGLSALIPVGNKADIDEADLLDYLRQDAATEAILIYMEGVKQGRRLIRALAETTPHKPVVVIKSGRSQRGAMAAASHTGSLAGSDAVFDAIMRQAGVLRAEHLEEALAWCKFLVSAPVPPGENTVIVTNGGGAGVAAADACEKHAVKLHDGIETLHNIFAPFTPALGSTKNPIDLTGEASAEHYERALMAALGEESAHAAIVIYCETAILGFQALHDSIRRVHERFRRAGRPALFCLLGGRDVQRCIDELRRAGVPAFGEVYTAASCLGVAYRYRRHRQGPASPPVEVSIDASPVAAIARVARAQQRRFLLAHEGRAVLDAIHIRAPRSELARSLGETIARAEEIGYPVVLKVVSRDILHKSDAGGVALDLENEAEVIAAYEAIMRRCRDRLPEARLEGMEVSEMIPAGTELIVGGRRDPAFGPILMFGLGGIYVEVLRDVAFRALPLGRAEIEEMMKETRAHRLLLGVRGEAPRDAGAVVDALARVAALLEACPAVADVEINPLVVFPEGRGACALDVRILLTDAPVATP